MAEQTPFGSHGGSGVYGGDNKPFAGSERFGSDYPSPSGTSVPAIRRGAKPEGLIPKDDPLALQDLVLAVFAANRQRDEAMQVVEELFENEHPIDFPGGVGNRSKIYSGIAAAYLKTVKGVMNKKPSVKWSTTTISNAAHEQTQRIEQFDNRVFDVMERQGGPAWAPVLEDTLKFGFGLDAVQYLPYRISTDAGLPRLDSYEKSDKGIARYEADRARKVRAMGTPQGKFPLVWRHVPSRDCYFRESPEDSGLSLVVEVRERYVKELLEDERYSEQLVGLQRYYDRLTGTDRWAAWGAVCRFIVISDRYMVSTMVLPGTMPEANQEEQYTDQYLTTQRSLIDNYGTGDLLEQHDNKLGRPPYTLTRGLTSNTKRPGYHYRGIFFDARHSIKALDHFLSWRLTRMKSFIFAPVVSETQVVNVNGVPTALGGIGPDGVPTKIILHPGTWEVTDLPVGRSLKFLTNPGGGEEEQTFHQDLRQIIDALTMPRTLFDASGTSSGYEYESVAQLVQAGLNTITENVKLGHPQRVELVHDWVRLIGEPLSVSLPAKKRNDRDGEWVTLDPDEDLGDALGMYNCEAQYTLRRPTQTAADIQNFSGAVASRMLTPEDARAEFGGIEDSQRIDEEWLIIDHLNTPDVIAKRTEMALQKAFPIVRDAAAEQQGGFNVRQMAQSSPTLLQALGILVPPGAPGSAPIEQYQQMAAAQVGQPANGAAAPVMTGIQQGGPPPPSGPLIQAGPTGAPPRPQPQPGQMGGGPKRRGRAPGQAQNTPGGPRRVSQALT